MKLVVAAVACFAFALVPLWMLRQGIKRDDILRNWPVADGEVTSRELRTGDVGRELDTDRRGTKAFQILSIRYTYEVDGERYEGEGPGPRLLSQRFRDDGSMTDEIRTVWDAHAPGTRIHVHHHPREPEKSYIVFQPTSGKGFHVGAILFWALLGVVLLIVRSRLST